MGKIVVTFFVTLISIILFNTVVNLNYPDMAPDIQFAFSIIFGLIIALESGRESEKV